MTGEYAHEEALQNLHAGCVDDDPERVHELLAAECANAEEASTMIEITMAHPRAMRCLLEHGADIQGIKPYLIESSQTLKLLHEFGYDLKAHGSLIMPDWAADREILAWLLDQGVDINQTDNDRTAEGFSLYPGGKDHSIKILNKVASSGDSELFDHLVDRGAKPSRNLAVHYASKCKNSGKAVAMVSNLVDKHKMNINADTSDLRRCFHDAQDSGTPLCSAVHHKNLPVVQELLRRGADPNQAGASGHRPVSKAIGDVMFDGFLPAFQPLLDAGADPNVALRFAVAQDKIELVKTLLAKGADPKAGLEKAHVVAARIAASDGEDADEDDEVARKNIAALISLLESWRK